jgi:hypothetical protein
MKKTKRKRKWLLFSCRPIVILFFLFLLNIAIRLIDFSFFVFVYFCFGFCRFRNAVCWLDGCINSTGGVITRFLAMEKWHKKKELERSCVLFSLFFLYINVVSVGMSVVCVFWIELILLFYWPSLIFCFSFLERVLLVCVFRFGSSSSSFF